MWPPGYSKTASPIQVLPRKASIITQPIRGIAMSVSFFMEFKVARDKLTTSLTFQDTAMTCLFMTGEVVCVWNGGVSKIRYGNEHSLMV